MTETPVVLCPKHAAGASKIEWTDTTWNPVTGCDRISPGCDHCYALTLAARLKRMGNPRYQVDGDPETSGPGFALTLHWDLVDAPRSWRRPRRVFVNSMSDLFHKSVPDYFIDAVLDTIRATPQHTYQVLTKRPQRLELFGRTYPPNLWLGTSIESDRYAFRARHLRATNAHVRFLSLEPLLGPVPSLDLTDIDWVIIGGESGHGARPMEVAWVDAIMGKAIGSGTAVFVKQLGSRLARAHGLAGKGGNLDELPPELAWLNVRDWPTVA